MLARRPGLLWLAIGVHSAWLNLALLPGAIADAHTVIVGTVTVGSISAFVSTADLGAVQNRLNNRPRKALGFLTPAEVFAAALASE